MFLAFVVASFVVILSLARSIIFFPSSAVIPSGPLFVPIETDIEVHNEGAFDLQVTLKSSSCTWLTAVLRESLIGPGEFTIMPIRASGMPERGIYNCSVAFISRIINDSINHNEIFVRNLFVERSITDNEYGVRPCEFSGTRSEFSLYPEHFSTELSLRWPTKEVLEIYEVFSESEFLDVGLNSEKRDSIHVSISTPLVSPGVYRSFITVQTNFDRIMIPVVFRQLHDTFRFVGEVLDFGLLTFRGQEVSRDVILEYSGAENLLIGSVFLREESPFALLRVLDPPLSIGHNRTILATLTFSAEMSGTFSGNVVVTTNQQDISQSYVLPYVANVVFENRIVHLQNAVLYFRPRVLYHYSSKNSEDLILPAGRYNIPLDDESFIIEEAQLVTCQEFLSVSFSFEWVSLDNRFLRSDISNRKITSKRSVLHVDVRRDVLFEELSYSTGFSRSCWIELASNISFHKVPLHLSTGRVEVDAIQATQLDYETKISKGQNGILFRDFIAGNIGVLSQIEPRDVKMILSNYNPIDEVVTALFDHTYNKNELSNFRRGVIGNACLCVVGYVPIGIKSLDRCIDEMNTNNVADYSYFLANSARSPHCICVGDEDRRNNLGLLLRGGFHTIVSLIQHRLRPTPYTSPLFVNFSNTERVTHYKVVTSNQEISLQLQYQRFHREIQFECVNSFFCNIFSIGMQHINIRAAIPSSVNGLVSPRFQFDALSSSISLHTQHVGVSGVYHVFDTLVSLTVHKRNNLQLFRKSMWHTALRLVATTAHLNFHTIFGNIQDHANRYFYYSNNIGYFNRSSNVTNKAAIVKVMVDAAMKQLSQIEMDCVDSNGNIHFPRLFDELTRFAEMLNVWYVKGLRLEQSGLLVSSLETTKSFTFTAPLAILPNQILPVSYELESPLLLSRGRTSFIYLAFVNPFEVDVEVAVVTNHSFAFMRLSQESAGAIDWDIAMGDAHSDRRVNVRPIVGENGMTESLIAAAVVFESTEFSETHFTGSNNNKNIGDYLIRFPPRLWTVAAHQSIIIGPIEVMVNSQSDGGPDSTEAEFTALLYNSFSGFDKLLLRLNSSNPEIVINNIHSMYCSNTTNCENAEPIIEHGSFTEANPMVHFPVHFSTSKMLRVPFNRLQFRGKLENEAIFNFVLQNIGSSMTINYLAIGDISCNGGIQQKRKLRFYDYVMKFLPFLSHLGGIRISSVRVGNDYIDKTNDNFCELFPLELKHNQYLELQIRISPLNIFQTFFLRLSLRELLPDHKHHFGFDALIVFEETLSTSLHTNRDHGGLSDQKDSSILWLLWNLDQYRGLLLLGQFVFTSTILVLVIFLTLNNCFAVSTKNSFPRVHNISNSLESFVRQINNSPTFSLNCYHGSNSSTTVAGEKENISSEIKKKSIEYFGVGPSKYFSQRLHQQKLSLLTELNASKALTPFSSLQPKTAVSENCPKVKSVSFADIDSKASIFNCNGGHAIEEGSDILQKVPSKRKGETNCPSKPNSSSVVETIKISNKNNFGGTTNSMKMDDLGQENASFVGNNYSSIECTNDLKKDDFSRTPMCIVENEQENIAEDSISKEYVHSRSDRNEANALLHGPPGLVQRTMCTGSDNFDQRELHVQDLVENNSAAKLEEFSTVGSDASDDKTENDDVVFQYQGQLLGDDSEFLFDVNPFISPQENKFLLSLPQSGLFSNNFQEFSLTRQLNIDLDFESDYEIPGQMSILDGDGSGLLGLDTLDIFNSSSMTSQQLGSIMSFLHDTSPVENLMVQDSPLSNGNQPSSVDDLRWMGMNIVGSNNSHNREHRNFFADDQFFNLGQNEPFEELEM